MQLLTQPDIDTIAREACARESALRSREAAVQESLRGLNAIVAGADGQCFTVIRRYSEPGRSDYRARDSRPSMGDIDHQVADVYIGKVVRVSMYDHQECRDERIGPYLLLEVDGNEVIQHEHALQWGGMGMLGFPGISASAFLRMTVLTPDMPETIAARGIYLAPGFQATEALLRKLGFDGEMDRDLRGLYQQMQGQVKPMEAQARAFFDLARVS